MKKVLRFLPLVLTAAVMVMIFLFSSQPAAQSNEVSRGVTKKIIDIFPLTAHHDAAQKLEDIKILNSYVRKWAHFIIYTLLGLCVGSILVITFRMNTKKKLVYITAVAVSCLYAMGDEFHQSFVDGRGPLVKDVIIDTSGAVLGCGLFLMMFIIWNKCRQTNIQEENP